MKKINISFFVFIFFISMVNISAVAKETPKDKNNPKSLSKTNTNDFSARLDANRIDYWISNNGRGATDPNNGSDLGLYFPAGSPKSVIFADGFVYSGDVHTSVQSKTATTARKDSTIELRSSGGTYNAGLQAGKILTPGFVTITATDTSYTPPVADAATAAKYRVYKVSTDWKTLPEGAEKEKYRKDYQEWPWQDGAPVTKSKINPDADSIDADGFKVPKVYGGQTVWFVTNDMSTARANSLYGSKPTGIEIQTTAFSFSQAPLNTMVFMKRKIINKSGLRITDMYVSSWSDPDVGDGADDLSGCDTVRKLGYVYNSSNRDATYNLGTVPAAGYVFFQGPLVPGAVSDSGISGEKWYNGKKNLPLSSFAFYINGGPAELADPPLGNPLGTIYLNRYQKGLNALGNPLQTALGAPTKFPQSGDPVKGTGDNDTKYGKGDRRILLSSGPFNMAPGDTQEIVTAVIAAQGSNYLASITSLKKLAEEAQKVFNKNFIANGPPPAPVVTATGLDKAVFLNWSDSSNVKRTENDVQENYKFEGYKVYQLPTPQSTASESKLIGTWDIAGNEITAIKDQVYDDALGEDIIKTVHYGEDGGLVRSLIIDKDYLTGNSILNNREYYYAVTAYNAYSTETELPNDIVGLGIPTEYENSLKAVVTVIPREPDNGVRYSAEPGSSVKYVKNGVSDGQAFIAVVDPSKLTGNDYKIEFQKVGTDILYNIKNVTTGAMAYSKPRPQPADSSAGQGEPIFEGLQAFATGPVLDFKEFLVVANANGALNPPEAGAFGFNGSGFPHPTTADRPAIARQQVAAGKGLGWGIHTADNGSRSAYSAFISRTTRDGGNWGSIVPYDFEMRFTATGGKAWDAYENGVIIDVPFELWNIGIGTPNDPSDDYRMFPYSLDADDSGTYNLSGADHTISGGADDPYTDWIYWMNPANTTPGQAGYDAIVASLTGAADPTQWDETGVGSEVFARTVLVNWNGGTAAPYERPLPETGTVFRILTNKPNAVTTSFTFTAPAAPLYDGSVAKSDLNKINVYPNPYFGASTIELSKYNRKVTFTHLPKTGVKIKIFTISGAFVTELVHENGTQFEDWSLLNFANLPVASGMYVAYIETAVGTKVLKIAVIQETQYLDNI